MAETGTGASTIVWRRLDLPGHDAARLQPHGDGWRIDGAAVFLDAAGPCRLDYVVECDAAWRTTLARVSGWRGTGPVDLDIRADAQRRWTLNGQAVPTVAGCDDVDLSITPATNTLPIRRLRLAAGGRAAVRAAWLRAPEMVLEPLDQVYEHVAGGRFRYQSGGGTFSAELDVRYDGLVTRYSGLWVAESSA